MPVSVPSETQRGVDAHRVLAGPRPRHDPLVVAHEPRLTAERVERQHLHRAERVRGVEEVPAPALLVGSDRAVELGEERIDADDAPVAARREEGGLRGQPGLAEQRRQQQVDLGGGTALRGHHVLEFAIGESVAPPVPDDTRADEVVERPRFLLVRRQPGRQRSGLLLDPVVHPERPPEVGGVLQLLRELWPRLDHVDGAVPAPVILDELGVDLLDVVLQRRHVLLLAQRGHIRDRPAAVARIPIRPHALLLRAFDEVGVSLRDEGVRERPGALHLESAVERRLLVLEIPAGDEERGLRLHAVLELDDGAGGERGERECDALPPARHVLVEDGALVELDPADAAVRLAHERLAFDIANPFEPVFVHVRERNSAEIVPCFRENLDPAVPLEPHLPPRRHRGFPDIADDDGRRVRVGRVLRHVEQFIGDIAPLHVRLSLNRCRDEEPTESYDSDSHAHDDLILPARWMTRAAGSPHSKTHSSTVSIPPAPHSIG